LRRVAPVGTVTAGLASGRWDVSPEEPARATRRRVAPQWLALAALVIAAESCLIVEAWSVDRRLEAVSTQGPMAPPAGAPEPRILGDAAADGYEWMRLTREAIAAGTWRLRRCDYENAPLGRDVYWSSGFSAWMRTLAKLHPAPEADLRPLEWAGTWANPLLLMLALPVVVTLAACRWGPVPGAALVAWMIGCFGFREPFLPAQPDHHGIILLACLGTLLGIVLAEGWPERRWRRAAMTGSAVASAVGMWTSAVTQSVVLAIVAGSVLVAALLAARLRALDSVALDPAAWRLWGRVGAALAVLFYFAEQFPDRLGMRLEVNHPLHALAWLGGSELLALVALSLGPAKVAGRARCVHWLLAASAAATLPACILAGGSRWFTVADPMLQRLVAQIVEFQPLASTLRVMRADDVALLATQMLVILLGIALVRLPRLAAGLRVSLLLALVPAAAFSILAAMQLRWGLVGSGAGAVLIVVVVAALRAQPAPMRLRPAWLTALLCVPLAWGGLRLTVQAVSSARHSPRRVTPSELRSLLARDIARTLRDESGSAPITILSSPGWTLYISYFGGFRGLGTLYWENLVGLVAAGEIWSAPAERALPLLQERGVTHVVLVSEEDFVDQWSPLLGKDAEPDGSVSFGRRLVVLGQMPPWLQPIPYPQNSLMREQHVLVRAYRVAPEQAPADARFHLARWMQAEGRLAPAEEGYRATLQLEPDHRAAREGLGLLLIGTARVEEGIAELARCVLEVPAQQREEAAAAVAERLAGAGHARDVGALAEALASSHGAGDAAVTRLAWILSTSSSDGMRDGRRAMGLVERLGARGEPAWRAHDVAAAAQAEVGDFDAARREIDAALAAAGDDAPRIALLRRRDAYARRLPWRE